MSKKEITKKPTGLQIVRNGSNFTCSWKIADKDYNDGQDFKYNINDKKQKKDKKKLDWKDVKIGKKVTSYKLNIDLSKYYPHTSQKLTSVRFKVRGNREKYKKKKKTIKPGPSDWSLYQLKINPPAKPSISAEHTDVYNRTVYSWGINDNQTIQNANPYASLEVWTLWTSKWNRGGGNTITEKEWTKKGRKVADGKAHYGSYSTPEDSSQFATPGYSYTRWFRVRSKGAGGPSEWNYTKHVYAMPKQINNSSAKLIKKTGGGYTLSATWNITAQNDYPIDYVETYHAYANPPDSSSSIITDASGKQTKVFSISCPADPSIWTKYSTLKDASKDAGTTMAINHTLADDECIYFRADTVHDELPTEGVPVRASGGTGNLAEPTVQQMIINPSTHRVSVTATNNSAVEESYLVFYYRTDKNQSEYTPIGILEHNQTQATFQLPEWESGEEISIGCQAMLANYSPVEQKPLGTVTEYSLGTPIMKSSEIKWDEGRVPMPPVIDLTSPSVGTIQVKWDWSWPEANQAEISWADHEDAWESTNAPTTYLVDNLYASQWNIAGLSIGEWWVRVRLLKVSGDTTIYGIYSDAKSKKLSSAPDTPALMIPESVVTETGSIVCYWVYTTNDGTPQMNAKIYEAFIDDETGEITYSDDPLAQTSTAQELSLDVESLGWAAGDPPHYLCVTVTSASGEDSKEFSAPQAVTIADKPVVTITNTSLVSVEIIAEDQDEEDQTVNYLTDLPLYVTATGAGDTGITRVFIERAENYHIERPDGRDIDGFKGETVLSISHEGESEFEIGLDDLQGSLDDTAPYILTVEVSDEHKQVDRKSIPFTVNWNNQAVYPEASVTILEDERIAVIRPLMPEEGYHEGDSCDIYRLSADRPELIYEGAQFGIDYVDPYPAIGPNGGHRIVYRTKNGDYNANGTIAWNDLDELDDDILNVFGIIIDFEHDTILLPYNVSLSNSWKKNFVKTVYLGGSVEGNWNTDVERTLSANTVSIVGEDNETIQAMRLLADYAGPCHIRTPDGSSFAANIDVGEDRDEKMINKIAKYRLNVTRVDSDGFDVVTLEEWRRTHPLELEEEPEITEEPEVIEG